MKHCIIAFFCVCAISSLRGSGDNQGLLLVSIAQISITEKTIEISCSIVNKSKKHIQCGEFEIGGAFDGLTARIREDIIIGQPYDPCIEILPLPSFENPIFAPQEKRELKIQCYRFIPMGKIANFPLKSNGDYVLNSTCLCYDVKNTEQKLLSYKVVGVGRAKIIEAIKKTPTCPPSNQNAEN